MFFFKCLDLGVIIISVVPEADLLHSRTQRMQWNHYTGILGLGKYSLAVEIDVPQPNLIRCEGER